MLSKSQRFASSFRILQIRWRPNVLFYFAVTKNFLRCLLLQHHEKMSLSHSIIAFTMISNRSFNASSNQFSKISWSINQHWILYQRHCYLVTTYFSTSSNTDFKDRCNSDVFIYLCYVAIIPIDAKFGNWKMDLISLRSILLLPTWIITWWISLQSRLQIAKTCKSFVLLILSYAFEQTLYVFHHVIYILS